MIRNFIEKHDKRVHRLLEIIPGFLVWSIILFPLWGSLIIPHIVAYAVLTFIVFWFYRSFQAAFFAIRGYFRIKECQQIDFREEYERIKRKVPFGWEEIKHVVLVVTVDEPIDTLRRNLDHLAGQKIAEEQLIVVMAFEARIKLSVCKSGLKSDLSKAK